MAINWTIFAVGIILNKYGVYIDQKLMIVCQIGKGRPIAADSAAFKKEALEILDANV